MENNSNLNTYVCDNCGEAALAANRGADCPCGGTYYMDPPRLAGIEEREMNDAGFLNELGVRALGALRANGCPMKGGRAAFCFIRAALRDGRCSQWRNCGRHTVNELSRAVGFVSDYEIDECIRVLRLNGFAVVRVNEEGITP